MSVAEIGEHFGNCNLLFSYFPHSFPDTLFHGLLISFPCVNFLLQLFRIFCLFVLQLRTQAESASRKTHKLQLVRNRPGLNAVDFGE